MLCDFKLDNRYYVFEKTDIKTLRIYVDRLLLWKQQIGNLCKS